MNRLSPDTISKVLSRAIKFNQFSNEDNTIIFHDLTFLENKINELKKIFPSSTLHAIAAKANPLPEILKYLNEYAVGLEAASIGEIHLALQCGYEPSKIVFDSPAKTIDELKFALEKGIHINADSINELKRIYTLLGNLDSKSRIGLRINPQVGPGKIKTTSVADQYSKFGVPLIDCEIELLETYNKYDWLTGVHIHIGSQGTSLDQLILANHRILEFIKKIPRAIQWIDIGGGLPVNYSAEEKVPTIKEYYNALKKKCPDLFNTKYTIITEFGRAIHANSGWTASRVEYLKSYGEHKTAIIHVGADQFLRRSYQSKYWHHDFSVMDKFGNLKIAPPEKVTIAGPLCFASDILAREIELPAIEEGDYIIIHDTGAYTLSMWSKYNSRLIPKAIGYINNGGQFRILKNKETPEELFKFWS